ncbi:winged helix-turn-helix transcriptional regulator [Haloarchaeobius amylolyticus]|uniref:winged helix-turn-helix transcriptional regulator n=1 Tax=Haloarchaeobius amylolyticus TaxID=1198296 RepID=UPI00226EE991|nr:helix-turn-helix domain-containing protein [Haloarchaeobius amylolyticus]
MDDASPLHEANQECGHLTEFDSEAVIPEVLSLFGKRHTLAIMYEFAFSEEPLRFSDLEERLAISSTTLSNRLSELTERGYVVRRSYDEIPPRVEYEATEKTHALTPIFEDLYDWAREYEADAPPEKTATTE